MRTRGALSDVLLRFYAWRSSSNPKRHVRLIAWGLGVMAVGVPILIVQTNESNPNDFLLPLAYLLLGVGSVVFIVGIIAAGVWSASDPDSGGTASESKSTPADELLKYADLLERGLISQEDFDRQRRTLLGD